MKYLIATYNDLMMNYNQWWYDTLGPTGVEITERISCVIFGVLLAWGIHEFHSWRKFKNIKKDTDEVK